MQFKTQAFIVSTLITTCLSSAFAMEKGSAFGRFGAIDEQEYKNYTNHITVKKNVSGFEDLTGTDMSPSHMYLVTLKVPDPRGKERDRFRANFGQQLEMALCATTPDREKDGLRPRPTEVALDLKNATLNDYVPIFQQIGASNANDACKKKLTIIKFRDQKLDKKETQALSRISHLSALEFHHSIMNFNDPSVFKNSPVQRLYISQKISDRVQENCSLVQESFLPILLHFQYLKVLKISEPDVWPVVAQKLNELPSTLEHIVVHDSKINCVADVVVPLTDIDVLDKFKGLQRFQVKGNPKAAFSFLYVNGENPSITFEGCQLNLSSNPSQADKDTLLRGVQSLTSSFFVPAYKFNDCFFFFDNKVAPKRVSALGGEENITFSTSVDTFEGGAIDQVFDRINKKNTEGGSVRSLQNHPDVLFSLQEVQDKVQVTEGRLPASLEGIDVTDYFCPQAIKDRAEKIDNLLAGRYTEVD